MAELKAPPIVPPHKPVTGPIPVYFLITILILLMGGVTAILYPCITLEEDGWKFKNYYIKEIPVPVTVEKKVEVVKWMEHIKMPTEMFIKHLKPSLDPTVATQIANAVDGYSKEYQLPKKLIVAIMFKESSFNMFARSGAGAIGLMQIIPKYHKDKIEEMGITDNRLLYHINNNIELGCKVWKGYYDQSKKDLDETFHRYLSKNASESQKNAYKGAILEVWARLEFLEFQYENGKGKKS